MIKCTAKESEKVEVVLIFMRDDLLYDIANRAYVEGDTLEKEKYHLRHIIQDIKEGHNADIVTRILELAHNECVEMLYPFTKREIDNDCLNNELVEKKTYGIVLNVPQSFSQTTINSIRSLTHEYMVCRVLSEWLAMSNPQKAQFWLSKVEELKERIKSKPRLNRARLRIRQSPM